MSDVDGYIGNGWDDMMTKIIDGNRYFDRKTHRFEHELITMEKLLNESSGIMKQLIAWTQKLSDKPQRSNALAMNYRTLGNSFFTSPKKNQDLMAVEFYTKAIYASCADSTELALAHANRAAVLWRLKYYKEGYLDCQLAIENKYPNEKMLKLLQRKKSLAISCQNPDYIRETIDELAELMKKQNATDEDIEKAKQIKRQTNGDGLNEAILKLKKLGLNKSKLSTNKELQENVDVHRGRFIKTTTPIPENESILTETAFAFVPVYNDYESDSIAMHCENCAKTNIIPFPCNVCARASYCSPSCQQAHHNIHRYECYGYSINLWKKIGIAHLALRNLLTGFDTIVNGSTNLTKTTPIDFWKQLIQRADNDTDYEYGHVLRLCTNFDKMESTDLLRYCLTSAMLIGYLLENTFFFELNDEFYQVMTHNQWVLFASAILMRHMGQLVSNGHAISEMEYILPSECGECLIQPGNIVVKGRLHDLVSSTRVFTAIFPKISLFNHSCDPNIRNYFDGNTLTVFASRNIPNSDEIFNCYGPNYKLMCQRDRQLALSQQYCFNCQCDRCTSNDNTWDKYMLCYCQNSNCRQPLDLDESQKLWWCTNTKSKIICAKCGHEFDQQVAYLKMINRNIYANPKFNEDSFRKEMLINYEKASQCLSEYHEHRQSFAQIILASGSPQDKSLYRQFSDIILDNLNASRTRFGVYSLEFVMASTYVLDFLAIIKDCQSEWEDKEEYEALRLFDLKEIIGAYSILSDRTRAVFEQYLAQYIL